MKQRRRLFVTIPLVGFILAGLGCRPSLIEWRTDAAYRLIAEGQTAALGERHDAAVSKEDGRIGIGDEAYSFNPSPIERGVPASFRTHEEPPAEPAPEPAEPETGSQAPASSADQDISPSIFSDAELPHVKVFDLSAALAYAMRHARDFQDAKEDLFLAALDLSLERHLWTPQFVASVQSTYTDFDDDSELDRSLTTVSDASVTQRLPWGGEVSARIVQTLVREIRDRVERGETGQVILDARVPLLRGAGRVAYESRYRAERELIYAVRRFERFRRSFLVNVAQDYLNLQQLKARIANTHESYLSQGRESEKAAFMLNMARIDIFQASRAKSSFRQAASDLVRAKQTYETALDRFKIRVAMPVEALLDVVDQASDESSRAVDALLPDVDERIAVNVATRYRLDLRNSADQLDDARRGVVIAKNRILPDLDVSGNVTFDSDPAQLRTTQLREERATWRGGVQFRIDDRRTEQNAYRASLIGLRRAERDHEQFMDIVRADARRAMRRIAEQKDLRQIEAANVHENELRLEAAKAQFALGRKTNQDVVDAENELLRARNQLAAAVAAYRVSVLEFRRDTGTLRVTDDGTFEQDDSSQPPEEDTGDPNDGG